MLRLITLLFCIHIAGILTAQNQKDSLNFDSRFAVATDLSSREFYSLTLNGYLFLRENKHDKLSIIAKVNRELLTTFWAGGSNELSGGFNLAYGKNKRVYAGPVFLNFSDKKNNTTELFQGSNWSTGVNIGYLFEGRKNILFDISVRLNNVSRVFDDYDNLLHHPANPDLRIGIGYRFNKIGYPIFPSLKKSN